MGALSSKYNQNRKMIWIIILIIIGVFSLIQIINLYYKKHPKDSIENRVIEERERYSVITKQTISEEHSDAYTSLIKEFFDFCNTGKVEEAYNILSTECKDELYPTIEEFKTKYINNIFDRFRTYNSSLWISSGSKSTYRIEIMGDLLSTGEIDDMATEDFYTVIKENDGYKLNINKFIGKEEINKENESEKGVKVTVLNKRIYMDYEIYQVKVENNTGTKIVFNTKNDTESIYIQDANNVRYYAQINQLLDTELEFQEGMERVLNFRFDRGYSPDINIKRIVFNEISYVYQYRYENIKIEL